MGMLAKFEETINTKKNQIKTWWEDTGKDNFSDGVDAAVVMLPSMALATVGSVLIGALSGIAFRAAGLTNGGGNS